MLTEGALTHVQLDKVGIKTSTPRNNISWKMIVLVNVRVWYLDFFYMHGLEIYNNILL